MVKDSKEVNTRHIETVPIFDDCAICGEVREKSDATIVSLKNQRNRVSIIECRCSRCVTHDFLLLEVELIDFCAAAGIIIG
jgi:hypothetical protein